MILVLTNPTDVHAFFVQAGLRQKGSHAVLWHTADFPRLQSASIETGPEGARWWIEGSDLQAGWPAPEAVWFRRPAAPILPEGMDAADLLWARAECNSLLRSLSVFLETSGFALNPPVEAARSSSKPYQQAVAARVGLNVPKTVHTNDPRRIRSFLAALGGSMIYKPFTQLGTWKLPDGKAAILYTTLLRSESLPEDEVLMATPGIYQELVPKAYELRITLIGDHVFPVKIPSQDIRNAELDWRRNPRELRLERAEISADLERALLRLMREMGLLFGCVDMIVTPEGDHVFLEVNEMGQFLFVEDLAGLPLLDAFCEMLIQKRRDFAWRPGSATLRKADFEDEVRSAFEEAQKLHMMPPEPFVPDSPS